jgi:MFS family permease
MPDTKRLFRTLAFANFLLYFGFEIWQDTFNNFAVEQLGVHAEQIGLLQSLREIPGLLGFALAFLVLWLSEMRVMGLSVMLLGVGLVVTGWAKGLEMLILGTVVMSTGFHFFYPASSSVVLMATDQDEAPKFLGRLRSVSSAAAVLATLAIWVLVKGVRLGPLNIPAWGYHNLLMATGAAVIVGSFLALRQGQRHGTQFQRHKIVLRRDYWLYYVLTFMLGSRRHIFTTFAIFLLVQVYGLDVRATATLYLINNLINTYTSAQFGKLVARFGERKVLTVNFTGLVGVFLGYAFIPYLPVLLVLFILDNVFFGFSLAVDSYFQKICRSAEEITSNLSMAQTINHISALVVPVLGGILWAKVSPSATFLAGVAIAVVSLGLVQFIRTPPAPAAVLVAGE